ncbi:hypothetical protein BKA80DRAFT_2574 [Phyllosticta citrichinensis]
MISKKAHCSAFSDVPGLPGCNQRLISTSARMDLKERLFSPDSDSAQRTKYTAFGSDDSKSRWGSRNALSGRAVSVQKLAFRGDERPRLDVCASAATTTEAQRQLASRRYAQVQRRNLSIPKARQGLSRNNREKMCSHLALHASDHPGKTLPPLRSPAA